MLRLQDIKGIGKISEEKLNSLGIFSIFDLLKFLPTKYIDLGVFAGLDNIEENQTSIIKAKFLVCSEVSKSKTKSFKAQFEDVNSNSVLIVNFFNQPYLRNNFEVGTEYLLLGKYKKFGNKFVTVNPLYENCEKENLRLSGVYTVYPLRGIIGQNTFKNILNNALLSVKAQNAKFSNSKFAGINSIIFDALEVCHHPKNIADADNARKLLGSIDTALAIEIKNKLTENIKNSRKVFYKKANIRILDVETALGFDFTDSQKNAINNVFEDLSSSKNMSRIICGDVGSGKTAVAFSAMLYCALNGFQSVMLAPTEILARQHFENFKMIAEKFNIKTGILCSSLSSVDKKQCIEGLKTGNINICFGTQSLLSDTVQYKNLSLAVVDEQHKFGVNERAKIEAKGASDILSMTATPIPRSLALTFLKNIDVSYIFRRNSLISQISTTLVSDEDLLFVLKKLYENAKNGSQSFIVCPSILDSEGFEIESIESFIKSYSGLFKDVEVGILHGKMSPEQKNDVMSKFLRKKIHILLSTTVIEVGIDTSADSILIINADRFGLSSLHQLRGRVGRNGKSANCYLHTKRLSKTSSEQRLIALVENDDGLILAEKDFELRGAGEILGFKQSGNTKTMIFELPMNLATLQDAKIFAEEHLSQFTFTELVALTRLNRDKIYDYYSVLTNTTLNS